MPPTPPLIALSGATAGFGGRPLFEGIDVPLSAGGRACLVGRNGSGKSTLLKLLAGDIAPDAGERYVPPAPRGAYLPSAHRPQGFTQAHHYAPPRLHRGPGAQQT